MKKLSLLATWVGVITAGLVAGCVTDAQGPIDGTYSVQDLEPVGKVSFTVAYHHPDGIGDPATYVDVADGSLSPSMLPIHSREIDLEVINEDEGHIRLTQPDGPTLDSMIRPTYEGEQNNRQRVQHFGVTMPEFRVDTTSLGQDCSIESSAGIMGEFSNSTTGNPLSLSLMTTHLLRISNQRSYPQTGQTESCETELKPLMDRLRAGQSSGFILIDAAYKAGAIDPRYMDRMVWIQLTKNQLATKR